MNKNILKVHLELLDKKRREVLQKLTKEIALQKAYTVGRRGEYRDYFDLYTILKQEYISLKEIISGAKQIYNGAFDEKLFLEQLIYFNDLNNFEVIPASQTPLPAPDEIKHYFETLVKTLILRHNL